MSTTAENQKSQVSPLDELLNRQPPTCFSPKITEQQVRQWVIETYKELSRLGAKMLSFGVLSNGVCSVTVHDETFTYNHLDTVAEARAWLATRTPENRKREELEAAKRKVAELELQLEGAAR